MKSHTVTLIFLSVFLLGITGFLTGCGDDDDKKVTDPTTAEYTVTVAANTNWTNTALELAAGNVVTFTATGTVSYLEAGNTCGPEGASWTDTADQEDPLWQQPHAGLIGKLGEAGSPFFIGASYSLTLDSNGTLFLGINDAWNEGNTGEFIVTIEVTTGS